ncbi:hypothetical protein [Erythrobacter rubeus]|uniref:Uncharacterized protein n=1 Tax=Erythrobacter rubeus TaxID=2760803 RepID=A0ABR8KNR4_9SPHN|nr:hypothetical protein [Erythrobacter rubeus]MBD2840937.1 hypothetical protein [Erythrobacter rubeus]
MSQQVALSSLFSVLALASLCLAAANGQFANAGDAPLSISQPYTVQAELSPGLQG